MKVRIKLKEANAIRNLFCVSYCELQKTLYSSNPIYYLAGIHGWHCDIYKIGDYYIAEGYKTPRNGKDLPHELCKQLEQQAQAIAHNWDIEASEKREKLETLLINAIEKMEH